MRIYQLIKSMSFYRSFSFVATMIPDCIDQVFHVNIATNGLLNTLPYIANYIFSYVITLVLNGCFRRGWISLTCQRKLATTVSLWGMAICAGLLPVVGTDLTTTMGLITTGYGLTGQLTVTVHDITLLLTRTTCF